MSHKSLRSNRKGLGFLVVVALLAVTITCGIVSYVYYTQYMIPTPAGPIVGNLNLDFVELNTFDRTAVSTTTPNYVTYRCNGQWPITSVSQLGSSTTATPGTAKTIGVSELDQGILVVNVYAGTAHFVDVKGMLSAHPRVLTDYCFADVNGDTYLDVLFKMDLATLGVNKQSTQSYQISVLTVPNDRASASLSSPADKAVGTGSKTATITWELSGFGEKKGGTLANIFVTHGTVGSGYESPEDYCRLDSFGVSYGDAYLGLSRAGSITYDAGAKRWSVNVGVQDYRQVVYSLLYGRSVGGPEKISFTATFKTNLTETVNSVTVTLYLQEMDPSSALATARSDAVDITVT